MVTGSSMAAVYAASGNAGDPEQVQAQRRVFEGAVDRRADRRRPRTPPPAAWRSGASHRRGRAFARRRPSTDSDLPRHVVAVLLGVEDAPTVVERPRVL